MIVYIQQIRVAGWNRVVLSWLLLYMGSSYQPGFAAHYFKQLHSLNMVPQFLLFLERNRLIRKFDKKYVLYWYRPHFVTITWLPGKHWGQNRDLVNFDFFGGVA